MATMTLSQSYLTSSLTGHFKSKISSKLVNPPMTSQGRHLFHEAAEGNPADCFRILTDAALSNQLTNEQILSLANIYNQSLLTLMAVLTVLKNRNTFSQQDLANLALRPKTVMLAKLVSYLYNLKDMLGLLRKLYGDTQDLDIILYKEYDCWRKSGKLEFDTEAEQEVLENALDDITTLYKKPLVTLYQMISSETKSILTNIYKLYLNDSYFYSVLKRVLPSNLARNCSLESGLNLFKQIL